MSDKTASGLSSILSEGVLFIPPTEDSECLTCNGRGGTLSYDSDGDGAWAMTYELLEYCPDCLGAGRCPGCGTAMTPEQQAALDESTESFTCRVEACGWHYDADRFYDDEDAWGYDG